jgi:hypothetical protein
MGNNANSTKLLQVPFDRSCVPFRMSKHDIVAESLMRFRLEPPGATCYNRRVFDADTKEQKFELVRAAASYRIDILTHDGLVVMSIKEKPFEGYYRVYEDIEREAHSFTVRVRGTVSSAGISCEFQDRISGDRVRLFTEGDCSDSVAIFYVERHAAELPRLLPSGNSKRTSAKVIGRIRRPELSEDEYLVGTGGVDMTMLLMLWFVRHDMEERQSRMGSVPLITRTQVSS